MSAELNVEKLVDKLNEAFLYYEKKQKTNMLVGVASFIKKHQVIKIVWMIQTWLLIMALCYDGLWWKMFQVSVMVGACISLFMFIFQKKIDTLMKHVRQTAHDLSGVWINTHVLKTMVIQSERYALWLK